MPPSPPPPTAGPDPTASRRRLLRRLAGLAAAVASSSAPPARAAQPLRQDWPRHRATPAPRLPLLDGGSWSPGSARGDAVLLNFWAGWCEPCRDEMPALARLARDARERGLPLRVVAVDYREPDDAVRRALERLPPGLPVALDRDGAAAKAFDVHAFPSTVAIDRRGRARFVVMGECDWGGETARRWIDELMRA